MANKKTYPKEIDECRKTIQEYIKQTKTVVTNGRTWEELTEEEQKTCKLLDKCFQDYNEAMKHFENVCYFLKKVRNFIFD